MPKKPASKARDGVNARGAARINCCPDIPNTSSSEYAEKFMGRSSTAAMLGDSLDSENEGQSPLKLSYQGVAGALKRPLAARSGVGHGRGKAPRAILRQLQTLEMALEAERKKRTEYERLAQMCLEATCDIEMLIVPQAEILCYSPTYLYIKYQCIRIHFAYLAQGHSAMVASEAAG